MLSVTGGFRDENIIEATLNVAFADVRYLPRVVELESTAHQELPELPRRRAETVEPVFAGSTLHSHCRTGSPVSSHHHSSLRFRFRKSMVPPRSGPEWQDIHALKIFSRPFTTFFVALRVSSTMRECSTMKL